MNRRIRLLALAVFGVLMAGMGLAEAQQIVSQPQKWDPEVLELASTLPVQEDGRVKPLSTYADFALLRLNGKRETKNIEGRRITSMEWMLDCLFYPDAAAQYKSFLVEAKEVPNAIGISSEGKKVRDRYSYAELSPGIPKLFELATQYSRKEDKARSITESQILNLAHNVREFELLTHFLDFARQDFLADQTPRLKELLGAKDEAEFTAIISKTGVLRNLYATLANPVEGVDEQTRTKEQHQLQHMVETVERVASVADALALFPPADADTEEWLTPSAVVHAAITTPAVPEQTLAMLASLEKLAPARDKPEEFNSRLQAFHDMTAGAAASRGDYAKVPLEYFYYKGDRKLFTYTAVLYVLGLALLGYLWKRPGAKWAVALASLAFAVPTIFLGYPFYNALVMYILSFIIVALLWVRPKSTFLGIAAPIAIAAPTIVLLAGITLRCIIRNRPPVTTLYETILFITACVVIVSLAIEWMNRRKLALSMAAVLGVLGLFLANKYEVAEGVDTMPSLVAVLDTNFWLSTHVTTVTLGYAAGLLAAALAHVYIFGRMFRRASPDFLQSVTRMTYGVLCFGLFFSVLGTVLGGIWANESWGRFWGWDPKENGALMIVLWELAILHGLAGRYIRDLGLSIACVLGGIVVAFSWWGVNLLGVGLHSYGFTSGAARGLAIFYSIESLVALAGVYVWWRDRIVAAAQQPELQAELKPSRPVSTGKRRPRTAKS